MFRYFQHIIIPGKTPNSCCNIAKDRTVYLIYYSKAAFLTPTLPNPPLPIFIQYYKLRSKPQQVMVGYFTGLECHVRKAHTRTTLTKYKFSFFSIQNLIYPKTQGSVVVVVYINNHKYLIYPITKQRTRPISSQASHYQMQLTQRPSDGRRANRGRGIKFIQ